MATRFSYFGFEYEINEDDKTVVLRRATSASGKVFIPKEVENGNKKYTVVGICGFFEGFYYWGGGEIETDGRKKNYWRVEPHWVIDHFRTVSPFTLFNGKTKTRDEWIVPNIKITSVVLPDTIKSLGEYAFYKCYALEEVSLPKSITNIPFSCFRSAKALKHIELHEGITSIECCAFSGCTALTEITIPSSVKTIDKYSFVDSEESNSGLKVVNILNDEGAVIIHPEAFLDSVKINYLGKNVAKKAKSESKPAPKPEPKPAKTASEPKAEPKPAAKVSGDFKKSAVSGDYTIGITPDNKVVVSKGVVVCDNAKGTMREISEKVGFKFETSWTTQQFGGKLVDFLNSK